RHRVCRWHLFRAQRRPQSRARCRYPGRHGGGFVGRTTRSKLVRVYVPATVGMLQTLQAEGVLHAYSGTVFALTPSLRESYNSGSSEELEYAAMGEAALASLRLLAADEETEYMRRAVVSADVEDVTLRPDLDIAVG